MIGLGVPDFSSYHHRAYYPHTKFGFIQFVLKKKGPGNMVRHKHLREKHNSISTDWLKDFLLLVPSTKNHDLYTCSIIFSQETRKQQYLLKQTATGIFVPLFFVWGSNHPKTLVRQQVLCAGESRFGLDVGHLGAVDQQVLRIGMCPLWPILADEPSGLAWECPWNFGWDLMGFWTLMAVYWRDQERSFFGFHRFSPRVWAGTIHQL